MAATVHESLIDLVKQIAAAHGSDTLDANFDTLVDQLEALVEPATGTEQDAACYLVSLMNLLLEVRRGSLPPPVISPFLSSILESLDRPPVSVDALMQGEEAAAELRPEIRVGCTMMSWSVFKRRYAPKYGRARSASDLEKLWEQIVAGELRVPWEDIYLTSTRGVVWITDEEALHASCGGSPPPNQLDGTDAYDALGLDWTSGWSYLGPAAEAPAVVLKAPVSHRRSADRGLRIPTSIDAWGSFGFVPRMALPPRSWPSNAGMTVDPRSGQERLPEAVHGPRLSAAGADFQVLPCTPVRKAIPGRIDECGIMVCMKAVAALRAS